MLYLLNAQLPEAHLQMLSHPDWAEAVSDPSRDPAKVPMLRAHLEYLAGFRVTRNMLARYMLSI